MHLGNATCKNIGINYEAALALDARSQKAECFRLIRLSVSASGRRFLPSADTHTHTYTLEVGPTPFGLPLIGLPYFVCIAGGFVAVSLVASIYLLHC